MKVKFGFGAVFICCVVLAACGSSNSGSSSGGGGGGGSSSSTSGGGGVKVEGAKVIDPNSLNNPPKGTIKYCQGKDTTGSAKALIKDFNAKYGAQGYKATLTEFPASADQQRTQFIQRQQAKSDDCDVFSSDVIWTAEFASQKWLYDLTPYVNAQKSKYIAAPLETVHYADKYWGVPETSDAAFIYYRTDKGGGAPPATWQEVYSKAKAQGGLVYQGAPYEGLTCDYLELAFAAGGTVLNDGGTKSTINSPQNIKALQLMVDGIKDGSAPKAVTTYMEPETDQAWTSGKYGYMRNWTYAYAADNKSPSKVAGQVQGRPAAELRGRRQGRHPRRPQQRDQRLHEEPRARAQVRGLLRVTRVPEEAPAHVLAGRGHPGHLQRGGRQEGHSVRAGAPAGAQPGQGAAGVAGVSADLAGDLQERQRRARRPREPGGRAEEGGLADQQRTVDLLT